jgi:3-hydroxyacyl-CoA dehydrogenase
MYRGGPMYWADSVGLPEIVDKIASYRDRLGGAHWELSPLLEKLAADGGKLHLHST